MDSGQIAWTVVVPWTDVVRLVRSRSATHVADAAVSAQDVLPELRPVRRETQPAVTARPGHRMSDPPRAIEAYESDSQPPIDPTESEGRRSSGHPEEVA